MKQFFRFTALATAITLTGLAGGGCADDKTATGPSGPAPFTITIEDYTTMSVTVKFTPTDPTMVYYSHVLPKKSFVNNWNSDVAKFLPDYITYMCEQTGMSRDEVIGELKTVGEDTWTEDSLSPDTDEVLFAVGIDDQGNPTTKPVFKEFRTKAVEQLNCTFNIAVSDISPTRAFFEITPSDKEVRYLAGAVPAETYPADRVSQREYIQEFANAMIYNAMQEYMVDKQMALLYISKTGDGELDLNVGALVPNTKYMTVVFGVDENGFLNTEIGTETFETTRPNTSANTFSVEVEPSAIGASVTVTPTNDDTYYVGVFTAESLQGISDDLIISTLIRQGETEMTWDGEMMFPDWEENLFSDTEYEVIVFGCDEWATTSVKHKKFKTLAGGNPASCTFTFDFDAQNFDAEVMVTPSDETVFYLYGMLPADEYPTDEDVIEEFYMQLEEFSDMMPTVADAVMEICYRGEYGDMLSVDPGETYRVFAFAVDPKTGNVATKIFKEDFQAPERVISTAAISVASQKYYDGLALYEADPEIWNMGAQNMAYTVVNFTTTDNAVTWYAAIYMDNLTDRSDKAIIKNLVNYGAPLYGKVYSTWSYFKDVKYQGAYMSNTLCAVAQDADGNFGPVLKQLFEPTKAGVSPISDVVNGSSSSAKVPYRIGMQPSAKAVHLNLRQNEKKAHKSQLFRALPDEKKATKSAQPAKLSMFSYGGGGNQNR